MAIGSLQWAAENGGNLTHRERAQLMLPILQTTVRYTIGRMRLVLGLRPQTSAIEYDSLTLPDSRLAKLAEEECRETLSPALVNHSYRTYLYALTLAHLDGVTYDSEHLYVTSLLHDIALENPQSGQCFALRGSEKIASIAQQADCSPEVTTRLSEAICMHITPGVSYSQNVLAALLNGAALVDILGMRLWDFAPQAIEQAIALYPRQQFKQRISNYWRAETKAVPGGRAAWIERAALFTVFARLAPFAE